MRVGYLGPHGTFSEEAAFLYFSQSTVEWEMYPSILDVLEAIQTGQVDLGIVPIENSIEGLVNISLDGLLENPDLFIQGEFVLPVSQHLLGISGATEAGIDEIWSIPPALAQCRNYIRSRNARVRHFDSTASAAVAVRTSGRTDVAAVASALAADQVGLEFIARNIQDIAENRTRFLVVSREQQAPWSAQKTMLNIVPCEERSGVLANMLHVFAALDLNLTWIESRPMKTRLGTYHFSLDVEAGWHDARVQKALVILETLGHTVRILGSYDTRTIDA